MKARTKLILRAPFSLKAIYELRTAPIIVTTLMIVLVGVLHFTPFTISFMGTFPYERHLEQLWAITDETPFEVIQALPVGCNINDLTFNCSEVTTIEIRDGFSVLINQDNITTEHGLIFMPERFQIVSHGTSQEFSYFHLQGLDFDELRLHLDGDQVLFDQLVIALQGVLMAPFIMNSYLTGILSFFPFVIGISAFSMLMKFRHTTFLKYREVLNIVVFSAFPSTIVVIIIGFITPAFTNILINFITPIVAYLVYKKYVIPELQGRVSE